MTPASPRSSDAGAWMRDLHARARAWIDQTPRPAHDQTPAYVDLLFAFGLARIGRAEDAGDRLRQAAGVLVGLDDAHTWLYNAFEYRVRQVQQGQPSRGALPAETVERLGRLERGLIYIIDRFRSRSRVLEPDQSINPYRASPFIDAFDRTLAELSDLTNPDQFIAQIREIRGRERPLRASNASAERHAKIIRAGLNRPDLAGPEFVRELLRDVFSLEQLLVTPRLISQWTWLLETALRATVFHGFREEFLAGLKACERRITGPEDTLQFLSRLTSEAVRGLFVLGLCDEADQFLCATSECLLRGRAISDSFGTVQDLPRLLCLVALCGGWYAFGWDALAAPIMDSGRTLLHKGLGRTRRQADQGRLACAMTDALRLATPQTADAHFQWIFDHLRGVSDTYTTSSHCQISKLDIIESIILTAVEVCSRR